MSGSWGDAWAEAFGDAWGSLTDPDQPSDKPRQDSIKWGLGPMVIPKKKDQVKTRQQVQNEALLILILR